MENARMLGMDPSLGVGGTEGGAHSLFAGAERKVVSWVRRRRGGEFGV
jgi:hypothetical protein